MASNLLAAIGQYRTDTRRLNVIEERERAGREAPEADYAADRAAEDAFEASGKAIIAWTEPAKDFETARSAVALANDEIDEEGHGSYLVKPLLKAALTYFQKPATEGIYGDLTGMSIRHLRHAAQCLATLHSTALMFAVSPWIDDGRHGVGANACQRWAWDICRQLCGEAEAIVAEAMRRPHDEDVEDELDNLLLVAWPLLEEPDFERAVVRAA